MLKPFRPQVLVAIVAIGAVVAIDAFWEPSQYITGGAIGILGSIAKDLIMSDKDE